GNFLGICEPLGPLPPLRRPAGMMLDRGWLDRNRLIVTLHPVAVVVVSARKSDHLPRRHVFVAAINRISKEADLRIIENEIEETLSAFLIELDLILLELAYDFVLAIVRQRGKFRSVRCSAVVIKCRKRLAIVLRRRDRRLRPLFFGALLERTLHIEPA